MEGTKLCLAGCRFGWNVHVLCSPVWPYQWSEDPMLQIMLESSLVNHSRKKWSLTIDDDMGGTPYVIAVAPKHVCSLAHSSRLWKIGLRIQPRGNLGKRMEEELTGPAIMITQNNMGVDQNWTRRKWECFSTGKNIVVRPGFQLTVVIVEPYLVNPRWSF